MENQYERRIRQTKEQAIISFAMHGACTLMSEWLHDGCRQSPEQEAELILKLVRRVCNR